MKNLWKKSSRSLRLEQLENRELLSATTWETAAQADAAVAAEMAATLSDAAIDLTSLVVTTADDTVDETDGLLSLREAIAAAQAGDVVTFADGVANIVLSQDWWENALELKESITIDGGDGVTIDASGAQGGYGSSVFQISGGTEAAPIKLIGLTITGGENGSGGGICVNSGYLVVEDSTITGNTSTSTSGGAGGAAVAVIGGFASLTNVEISGNTALGSFSAVYFQGASGASFDSCLIVDNKAEGRYAIGSASGSGEIEILNTTIAGNDSAKGSAFYSNGAAVTIANSIIAENTIAGVASSSADVSFRNGSVNATNTLSTFTGWTNGQTSNYKYVATEPLFTDAANGDYSLAQGSQALGKGENGADLGAFDSEYLAAPTITVQATSATTVTLTLGEVANAAGYVVQYATSADFADAISVEGLQVSGLSSMTTYYFRAKALGDGETSFDSGYAETSTATKPQTPGAITFTQYPGGPAGEPVDLDGAWLRVRWDYCENKPEYVLYYRPVGATEWSTMDVAAETKEITAGPYMYDLTPGVEYEFYAVAVDPTNAENVSEASEIKTFRMMTAPVVDAPVFDETTGRVEFSWTADEDSSKYRVEFSTVPFDSTATSSDENTRVYVLGADDTSIDFGSLEAGQTYYFRVRSHNVHSGGGTSAWSYATWTPESVDAPVDLSFTQYVNAEGKDWVRVRWSDVSGETGYRVEYRVAGETEWNVAEETKANAVLGSLYDLTPGTTYEYRVVALSGAETAVSEVASFTLLAAPTVETPVYNASTGRVTFSWNEAENVDKYRVELSTVPFGEEGGKVRVYVVDGDATSQSFGSLEAGQTYYFRVRAHQASGEGNSAWAYSSWTPETLDAPEGLSFTQYVNAEGEDWIRVRWADVEGETGYRVEYRAVGETEWKVGDETKANATLGALYNLTPGATYEYRVVAVRGAETAASEASSFALLAAPTVETPVYNASTGRVTFSWNEAENVEKYRVELSTADGEVRVYVLNGSATSQSFGSLEAGKTYYFRARAHQASGAGNSAWSEVVEFTVPTATEVVSDAFADFFAEEGEDDFWFEFEKALGGRSK